MSKEVDINAESPESEPKQEFGPAYFKDEWNPDDWEVYQTDVNLHFTFLGNPIYWLRFRILWGGFDGYGIMIGPFVLNLMIHRLMRPKQNIDK